MRCSPNLLRLPSNPVGHRHIARSGRQREVDVAGTYEDLISPKPLLGGP